MAGYDGLVLDHDGVIVTLCQRSVLREAAAFAFADAGIGDPRPEDVDTLTIRVLEDELRRVANRYEIDPDELWRYREDRIDATLRAATEAGSKAPYDDVTAIEHVDVPIGIASNNQTRIVEFVLEHYGLRERIETVHARSPTRESLQVKKPEPTFLEAAAADLNATNPLYVGDSESDVVAGDRAGFDTVFLRRGHNADRRLEVEPTIELESLESVVELL